MDIQVTMDTASRTATLRLGGTWATEHATALAAGWGDLLRQLDAVSGLGRPGTQAAPGEWHAFLDMRKVAAVGLAFFEVTAAAYKALSRRGAVLSRQGTLPDPVGQAARLSGFARMPGLTEVFTTPEMAASGRR